MPQNWPAKPCMAPLSEIFTESLKQQLPVLSLDVGDGEEFNGG